MQGEGYDEYQSQLAADLAAVTSLPAEEIERQMASGESITVTPSKPPPSEHGGPTADGRASTTWLSRATTCKR